MEKEEKYYKVDLYFGSKFVGNWYVSAYDEDQAREIAWELQETDMNSECTEISLEEYKENQ